MTNLDSTVLSLETVSDLLSEVVNKENVIDPVYEITSGSEKGDGYTSILTKVNVRGKNKTLPIIIKSAPKNPKIRNLFPTRAVFLQEIKYYREILPALKKFQEDRGVNNPFVSIPVCYETNDTENDEMLILENIKESGFEVFDMKTQMDEAHVEMVLRLYGKFHAISFCMRDHEIGRFEELTKNIDCPWTFVLNQEFVDLFLEGIEKIKSVFDEDTEPDVRRYISSLREKMVPFFESLGNYNGKYGVLVHGDCWCNNMMFKYEGENSTPPTDIRLFDFQMGTLLSPVIDIAYFFYMSASQDMMDNLDYYQRFYHDSLRKHMLEMGSDVDEWFPYAALKEDWKEFAKFGILMATGVYRIMLRDKDEILDFSDDTNTVSDKFMHSSKNDHLINEKYRRIGLHFYNNKF